MYMYVDCRWIARQKEIDIAGYRDELSDNG